jgi:hypothetical protein
MCDKDLTVESPTLKTVADAIAENRKHLPPPGQSHAMDLPRRRIDPSTITMVTVDDHADVLRQQFKSRMADVDLTEVQQTKQGTSAGIDAATKSLDHVIESPSDAFAAAARKQLNERKRGKL